MTISQTPHYWQGLHVWESTQPEIDGEIMYVYQSLSSLKMAYAKDQLPSDFYVVLSTELIEQLFINKQPIARQGVVYMGMKLIPVMYGRNVVTNGQKSAVIANMRDLSLVRFNRVSKGPPVPEIVHVTHELYTAIMQDFTCKVQQYEA